MSTSKLKIASNRKSAKKSTGPRTPEGKARSSRNAITHGLHATDIVIDSPHLKESREEYDALVDSLFDELKPKGAFQEHLVAKIANCMWRYRRAVIAESAIIREHLDYSKRHHERRFGDGEERQLNDSLSDCLIPWGDHAQQIVLYEMRLDRQLARAYALLNHLKRLSAPSERGVTHYAGDDRTAIPSDHTDADIPAPSTDFNTDTPALPPLPDEFNYRARADEILSDYENRQNEPKSPQPQPHNALAEEGNL